MNISERIRPFRKEKGYTSTINHDDITNLVKIFNKTIEEIVGIEMTILYNRNFHLMCGNRDVYKGGKSNEDYSD